MENKEIIRIKEKIINASIDLFSKRDVKSVSFKEISDISSVDESVIYEYFKDKDHILECIYNLNLTTKQKILITSLDLFCKSGFNNVTMREIASAVEIKAASIYNHFKSKDEILNSLYNLMDLFIKNLSLSNEITIIEMEKSDPKVILKDRFIKFIECIDKHGFDRIFRFLFGLQNEKKEAKKYLNELFYVLPERNYEKIFSNMITRKIITDKYPARMLAETFNSFSVNEIINFFLSGKDMSFIESIMKKSNSHIDFFIDKLVIN